MIAGGYPDEATITKIETDHQNRHKTVHPTHTNFSVTREFHAAEITHAYDEDTTGRQTTTSTTYVDVPNMSIASSAFTAGEKYLIVAAADLDNSNVAANSDIQVVHGTTAFAQSEWSMQPNTVAPNALHYQWWTVWTAVSGEALKMQYRLTGSGTAGVDLPTLLVIKLTGDLVENTDWHWSGDQVADTSIVGSDTATNNASITFTPGTANDVWLVLSHSRVISTSTVSPSGSKIIRTGEASTTGPYNLVEGEDPDDDYIHFLAGIYVLGAASNTFTEKSYGLAAGAGTRKSSSIFALNLSKFKNVAHSFDNTNTNVTQVATGVYATQTATTSITPTVASGNVWVFGFVMYHHSAAGQAYKMRIQFDNTDLPANQTARGYFYNDAWDSLDETIFFRQGMASSVSAAAHTIDMDMQAEASQAGRGFQFGGVAGVTMELAAAAGTAFVKFDPATVGLTEAMDRIRGRISNLAETIGLAESQNRAMNITRMQNEVVGLQEAINQLRQRTQQPAEIVGLQEALNAVRGRLFNVPTETVGITESTQFIKGRIQTLSEIVGLSEQIALVRGRQLNINETLGLSETLNTAMNKVRILNETVGLTEALNATRQLNRIIDETVGLTETVNFAKVLSKTISETVGLQETLNNIVGKNLTINETLGLTEAQNVARSWVRIINETIALSEAVNFAKNYVRILNETVGLTETVNRVRGLIKQVNETVGLTEALNSALNKVQAADEIVGLTEAINTIRGRKLDLSDTVGITETLNYIRYRVQIINETVGVSEQVDRIRGRIQNINENIGLAEAHNIARNLVRIYNEQVGVSESLNSTRGLSRTIDEAVGILEASQRNLALTRVINETLGLTEALNTAMNKVRIINETVGLDELVNAVLGQAGQALTQPVNESLNISELINIVKGKNVVINENVSLSEGAIVFAKSLTRIINEDVGLVESINTAANFVRNINESVHLTEQLNTAKNLVRMINETVDIAEAANYVRDLVKVLNETVGLSETQMSAPGKVKVINEALAALESIISVLAEGVAEPTQIMPSYNMALSPARRRRFPTVRRQETRKTKVIPETIRPEKYREPRPPTVKQQLENLKKELKIQHTVESSLTLRWRQEGATSISALLDRLVANAIAGKTLQQEYKRITIKPKMRQSAINLEPPSILIKEDIRAPPLPIKTVILQTVEASLSIRYNILQLVEPYPLKLNWQILNDVNTQLVIKSTIEDRVRYAEIQELKAIIETLDIVSNSIMATASVADIQKQQQQQLQRSSSIS